MATHTRDFCNLNLILERARRMVVGLAVGIVAIACSGSAVAQEPPLSATLEAELGEARLKLPSTQPLTSTSDGPSAPRPIAEPAPLQMDPGDLSSDESAEDRPQPIQPADSAGAPIEVVRERYSNRSVRIEREVTQDAAGNYVNHGTWKEWDERGNLVADGQYEMGARVGRWTRWHRRPEAKIFAVVPFSQAQEPFVSQATFENDLLEGAWIIYDSKQRPLSRITFSGGQRHGPATLWLPTGQVIRQMTYSDGELEGDVMELGKDSNLAPVATYRHGRRSATKVTYFKGTRNKQTEATYLFAKLVPKSLDDFWNARFADYESVGDDERHGQWTTWYENGQIQIQGQYENDQPVGRFTWWHPNGQKYAEGEYATGMQHGVWRWWHANGQKWTEGEFKQGEQTGDWSTWTETGRLDQQATYSSSRPQESIASLEEEDTSPVVGRL